MICFTLFGVKICIHPSLWLMLGLVGWAFAGSGEYVALGTALFAVAGFVCLLMHELGHALAGRLLGGGNPQVFLAWMGGGCCNHEAVLTRAKGVMMTAAGPLASLLPGVLAMLFLMGVSDSAWEGLALAGELALGRSFPEGTALLSCHLLFFVACLLQVSLWWSVLNLLPIFPLDGGLMMHGLMESPRFMHRVSIAASCVMAVFFWALGLWFFAAVMALLAWFNGHCLRNHPEP